MLPPAPVWVATINRKFARSRVHNWEGANPEIISLVYRYRCISDELDATLLLGGDIKQYLSFNTRNQNVEISSTLPSSHPLQKYNHHNVFNVDKFFKQVSPIPFHHLPINHIIQIKFLCPVPDLHVPRVCRHGRPLARGAVPSKAGDLHSGLSTLPPVHQH